MSNSFGNTGEEWVGWGDRREDVIREFYEKNQRGGASVDHDVITHIDDLQRALTSEAENNSEAKSTISNLQKKLRVWIIATLVIGIPTLFGVEHVAHNQGKKKAEEEADRIFLYMQKREMRQDALIENQRNYIELAEERIKMLRRQIFNDSLRYQQIPSPAEESPSDRHVFEPPWMQE